MNRVLPWSLAVLVLSACGEKSEAPAPAASEWPSFEAPPAAPKAASAPMPRACVLVQAADAQAVLGQEAGLMSDEPESCIWSSSAGVGKLAMFSIMLVDNEDVAMAQQVFNGAVGSLGNLATRVNEQVGEKTRKSGQEFDDLGDEAWISAASVGESFGPHGVGAQQLVVRKGTRVLTFNVTGTSKVEGLGPRLEALARKAVVQL